MELCALQKISLSLRILSMRASVCACIHKSDDFDYTSTYLPPMWIISAYVREREIRTGENMCNKNATPELNF